ncbi:hypothetical protein HPB48_011492 [Haemaphysalis longicornis]|uniref:Uncharacterized protein n=1 Tax=Haemaphysalis longicornis TaxID=44386 RepID=A0A9J6G948_HAELO|nr:hypothetical protein HPB48_011492 [Haemaphysalis longicornis]
MVPRKGYLGTSVDAKSLNSKCGFLPTQEKPPVYPLENIRAPVALFRGLADIGTQPRDYEDLKQRLRHVLVADYIVPDPKFTHLDFVFGFNATDILHVPMMSVLRNYTASDA